MLGLVGSAYLLYGRKQAAGLPMLCGLMMMVEPYVVPGFIGQLLVGILLAALPHSCAVKASFGRLLLLLADELIRSLATVFAKPEHGEQQPCRLRSKSVSAPLRFAGLR